MTAGATVARVRIGGLEVSRLGFGAMVLSPAFGEPDPEESAATFEAALDAGVDFVDTADCYSGGDNERFVGRLLRGRRDRVVLASKFGLVADAAGGSLIDGRPAYARSACEASLRRLGVDHIDLYYLHRVDPDVPLEETVGAMAALVAEGKVGHIGLCEVSAAQLTAACAVHPVTAVESEWSLMARQIEDEVVPTARSLGVGIVPYSPLGRGFLTGALRAAIEQGGGDLRQADPRLQGENLERNLRLVDGLEALAGEKGCSAAQLALAWLWSRGDDVVPIPGMERRERLRENVAALDLELSAEERSRLEALFPPGAVAGNPDATLLRGAGIVGSGGRG